MKTKLNYQEPGPKPLMNKSEAADYLGLGWKTFNQILKNGELKMKKYGGHYIISRIALDRWIQSVGIADGVDGE